jgi:hypothetical protein
MAAVIVIGIVFAKKAKSINLEGDMYTTKEAAEQHLPVQIKNAEAIIDACKKDENDYIMEVDF